MVSAPDCHGMILIGRRVAREGHDISCYLGRPWAFEEPGALRGERVMTGWYAERAPDRSAKAVIAVTLLALVLVAAVPVALLAAAVMMVLGHVVGGLALFGGSILAAAIAVAVAGMSGLRHLRKLVDRGFGAGPLAVSVDAGAAEAQVRVYTGAGHTDRSAH